MPFTERRVRGAAARRHVDRRLRARLYIFMAIFVAAAALDAFHIVHDRVNPLWAVGGFAVGSVIGITLARVKVLGWNASDGAVVGTTDTMGATILLAYVIFLVFFKGRVVESQATSPAAGGVVGLAMTAGVMLGRVAATRRGIRRLLISAGFGAD